MIPKSVIDFLVDWCVECDDEFQNEAEHYSCAVDGHHRALTGLDWRWVICDHCQGHGVLCGWEGAYTESDRAEWSDDDYEDYSAARRPCGDCAGTGKVRDLTDEAYERPVVRRALDDHYDMEATYRMERMMGA